MTTRSSGLSARRILHAAGAVVATHQHDQGQLLLVDQGTLMIRCEAGWWLAPLGQALWIPPLMRHSASYSESSTVLRLMLPSAQAPNLPCACRVFSVSNLLKALVLEATHFDQPGRDHDDVAPILALIVHQLQRHAGQQTFFLPGARDRRLQTVMEYLKRAPEKHDSIEQLARMAHCSSRTLARLFESETGMNFSRWRDQLRLMHAVDRLARGQSVTRTALELGFQSPSSFSTMFTRVVGISPSRYASRNQQAIGGGPHNGLGQQLQTG